MLEGNVSVAGANDGRPVRRPGIQVIARAAEIMAALEQADDGMALSELAAIVGMPRSSVHRIASALVAEGLLASSPRGLIRLGPRLISLARASRWHLGDAARPRLAELSRTVGETVELGVLQGSSLLLVDQVVAQRRLRTVSTVGARFASFCTAGGKALLAQLPDEALAHLLPERLERRTENTITRRDDLLVQLAAIRESGVAFDHEEESKGISGVAVVIGDAYGDTASVTVSGPSGRIEACSDYLAAALLAAAGKLNAALRSQ
jgi:DNA-binding IclR family transcriptional regulator